MTVGDGTIGSCSDIIDAVPTYYDRLIFTQLIPCVKNIDRLQFLQRKKMHLYIAYIIG